MDLKKNHHNIYRPVKMTFFITRSSPLKTTITIIPFHQTTSPKIIQYVLVSSVAPFLSYKVLFSHNLVLSFSISSSFTNRNSIQKIDLYDRKLEGVTT